MCEHIEILAESGDNHFIAYCPVHEEFQLAWNRITLHLDPVEFEELQTMFEEVLLDEMLTLLHEDEQEWGETMRSEWDAYEYEDEEGDEDDEGDDIVLWFGEVALRVTIDEFQELAFLISEAALAVDLHAPQGLVPDSAFALDLALPPMGMSLFSLN